MSEEMTFEEKDERNRAILNFLWTCPANEAQRLLAGIENSSPSMKMALIATTINPARGIVKSGFTEKDIEQMYIDAENAILGEHSDGIDYHDEMARLLLTCPTQKTGDYLNALFEQDEPNIFSVLISLVAYARKNLLLVFTESDVADMYLKNKMKMDNFGLYSGD